MKYLSIDEINSNIFTPSSLTRLLSLNERFFRVGAGKSERPFKNGVYAFKKDGKEWVYLPPAVLELLKAGYTCYEVKSIDDYKRCDISFKLSSRKILGFYK